MTLKEALGYRKGEMLSLIGAGGKTTALFRLAHELFQEGQKVLVTTTTKIYKPVKPHVHKLYLAQDLHALTDELAKLPAPIVIGAGYGVDDAGKLLGLPPRWLDSLHKNRAADAILVEADGAASRFFKVPSEHEPTVPEACSVTVWVMAIKALNRPIDSGHVHRAERTLSLLNVKAEIPLTADHVVQLIKHPAGCLKGIPSGSRKLVLLNQADSPEETKRATELGHALVELGIERAVITSFLDEDPVKQVIDKS